MGPETIALSIFVLTYLLIMSEMVHKTVAALIGALLMVVYGVVEYHSIGALIDFKTLTVVLGMLITINVVELSGLFEFITIKALKFTKGDPVKLLYATGVLASIMTVFLTTIPTAIILATLMFKVCNRIKLNPVPYLITIGMLVNVAGLLTPVSSLPNMMISSSVAIRFTEFTFFMLPLWIILIVIALSFFRFFFRNDLKQNISKEELSILMDIDEFSEIKNRKLFNRSCIILVLIIIFFFIQDFTGIGNEAVAITGAIVMLLLSSADPDEVFSKAQWSVLAFFMGLFIVIGGIEHAGILEEFSKFISGYMSGAVSSSFITISISAIVSSIVDNVPVTALLLPVAKSLTSFFQIGGNILFYSIATGAALGGNMTPIGSPSNIIILHMLEKKNSIKFGFGDFIKIGGMLTIIHIFVSLAYFYVRILLL